ncbi:hypothetical protein RRF57_006201 [Xylaria bambusicola]|uniref:Uncharacterized protein n=1 Tax=Xylaria bambusicola TaxID=326684 RepID=A0AAN7Z9Q3_9PEZI
MVCDCGKTVKGESALAQHKRDSPRHRQSVEPAGSNDPTVARGLPSISGPVPSSSRYPPIQFVRAGESIGDNGRKQKGQMRTKKTGSRTGSDMPPLRVTEYEKLYVSGLGDEDWSLCDKDCGWCDIQRFMLPPHPEKLKIYIISTPSLWETVYLDELEMLRRLNVVSGAMGDLEHVADWTGSGGNRE